MLTMDELHEFNADVLERIAHLGEFLKIAEKREEMAQLEEKMTAADFWDKKEAAQATVSALSSCRNIIAPYEAVKKEVEGFADLLELAEMDEEMQKEVDAIATKIKHELDSLELVSFLSGPMDHNNAFFTIHAGAGGTESCDWASMLMRMYRRYFERCGWQDEILDQQDGEEAGIKSVTMRVVGDFAYGYLKAERGIHRLVRISPFDSNARRHTSFASVDMVPELSEDIAVEVDEKDLRVDTYRSSGHGGQGVNTTDSAVRITHLPTGIVVCCQNERSQHKNRASAMSVLKAKLYELEERKRREESDSFRGEKTENGWGNQIRSYVLQPYQMVKDLRTEVETSNTAAVLDGDIQDFIESYLRMVR